MKQLYLSFAFSFFLYSCAAQSNLPASDRIIKFDNNHIELGEVKRGETREMEYNFTNIGKEDIEITFVSSCECTTVKYPRKAIQPGESGTLKVVFDSTEKELSETVDIDVYLSNVDPDTGEPIWFILDYSFVLIH